MTYSERLTQLDHSFLIYEGPNSPMHVAVVQLLEAGPLRRADGAIDIDRIEAYVASRLDRIPRYRQRLAWTPAEGHPVWIDDDRFNLHYHLRHAKLPRPGSIRQLKRSAARILSQHLDRDKPLWELWVLEGVEDDRIALISKTHHCMVDGISGSDLLAALMTDTPTHGVPEPSPFEPRPAPGRLGLLASDVQHAVAGPLRAASVLADLARDARGARDRMAERLRAAGAALASMGQPTPTPFNQPVGPYRRFDWHLMSFDRLRSVRRKLGGTINDIVLATTAGAVGRFLENERGVDLSSVDFRVMAPVSLRTEDERGALGNRVSAWMLPLPIAERDPLARLERVRAETEERKASNQALGAGSLMEITEWTGPFLLRLGAALASQATPFSLVVTNVPGPPVPLYLLGSKMLEAHPVIPLMGNLALGIALFSYAGELSWGFTADWDLFPDLHELVLYTEQSFEALVDAAGV